MFEISGYFKDDKSEFDGLIVTEFDSCPEDMNEEDIFFFGLGESDLKDAIKQGDDTCQDFVITGYTKL